MLIHMSKPSARRLKKKKAREKETAKRKLEAAARRKYIQAFPKFRFVEGDDTPPELVRVVKSAVSKIDFNNRTQFAHWERSYFKRAKRYPVEMMVATKIASEVNPVATTCLIATVGQVVFDSIPRKELLKWIPYHDVQFIFDGTQFWVEFRSLKRRESSSGTIFFSKHRPTVKIGSESLVIGWSAHAIERTCQRLIGRWDSYLGMGSAFAFFDQCIHFELATLHTGQFAFSFYDDCRKGFPQREFVSGVLGSDDGRDGYCFRVGYCPAVVEDGFLKATSLLVPGYRGTPEYNLIVRGNMSRETKAALAASTENLTMPFIAANNDYSLLKWFHDQGIPQVIHTTRRMYAP